MSAEEESAAKIREAMEVLLRLRGEAESHLASIRTARSSVESDSVEADRKIQTATAALGAVEETRGKLQVIGNALETEVLQARSRIAELSGQVESAAQVVSDGKVRAESVLAATEDIRRATQAAADEVERTKAATAAAATVTQAQRVDANTEATATKDFRVAAENTLAEIKDLRTRAEAELRAAERDNKVIGSLAATSSGIEGRVGEYESRLQGFVESYTSTFKIQTDKIETLLPGATSTGLAAAFERRRQDLQVRQVWWTRVFYASLAALFVATAFGTGMVTLDGWYLSVGSLPSPSVPLGPQDVLTWTKRLAFVIAPLWMTLLSNRQMNTFAMLEEDYAHKVAMSNSFEGYKTQLKGVAETETSLNKHIGAVIDVLSHSPVRLFSARHASDSPLETATDAGLRVLEGARGLIDSAANAAGKVVETAGKMRRP